MSNELPFIDPTAGGSRATIALAPRGVRMLIVERGTGHGM